MERFSSRLILPLGPAPAVDAAKEGESTMELMTVNEGSGVQAESQAELPPNVDGTDGADAKADGTPDAEKAAPAEAAPADRLDGGKWAILVVVGSFLFHFFVLGVPYTAGVFQKVFVQAFGIDQFTASWVGTLQAGFFNIVGLVAGGVADRFGYQVVVRGGIFVIALGYCLGSLSTEIWHVYLTFGALTGLGGAFAYYPAVSVVSQWFVKHRALATGIAVSGSGIGGLVFGPLVQYLVETIGWQWTLRIIGLVDFVVLNLLCFLLRQRVRAPRAKLIDITLFRQLNYSIMFFGLCVGFFGYWIPFYFLPTYVTTLGFTSGFGALVLGVLNGSSAFGRIGAGLLADRVGHYNVFASAWIATSLMIFLWPLCTNEGGLIVFAVLFGLSVGSLISLLPVVASRIIGLERLASAMGVLYCGGTVGNVFGPVIGAKILDLTAPSFTPTIMYSAVMMSCGAFLMTQLVLVTKFKPVENAWKKIASVLWCR